MGYTLGQLRLGASSHNNDVRPFTAIPERLAGRTFTQVVSGAASSVRVQFLSSGRLYVLAGTDWTGYYIATAWLGVNGEPAPAPFVETGRRPAFEVWSLLGERGDQFVIPTQVMLVSDYLEQRALDPRPVRAPVPDAALDLVPLVQISRPSLSRDLG